MVGKRSVSGQRTSSLRRGKKKKKSRRETGEENRKEVGEAAKIKGSDRSPRRECLKYTSTSLAAG